MNRILKILNDTSLINKTFINLKFKHKHFTDAELCVINILHKYIAFNSLTQLY